MGKNKVKAFTLVEMVIVIVVTAILFGVLFQVYNSIAQTSVRVRLQKELGTKMVHMQTMLQNIIDTHTFDYKDFSNWGNGENDWWTKRISLVWLQDNATEKALSDTLEINGSWALLYTTTSWDQQSTVSLLGEEVYLKNGYFVVSPLKDPNAILPENATQEEIKRAYMQIKQPWVRLIGTLGSTRDENMALPIQSFYTFIQK